jgi:hypothetical protein
MVTMNNHEEYMILFADGELNEAEQEELLAFVKARPELETEMKAYTLTKLTPDANQTFGDKETLYQIQNSKFKIQKRGVINLRRYITYGVAAGVASLLITLFIKWNNHQQETVVKQERKATEKKVDTVKKDIVVQQRKNSINNIAPDKKENKNRKRAVTKTPQVRYTYRKQKQQIAPQPEKQNNELREQETITLLEINPTKGIRNTINKENNINEISEGSIDVARPDVKTKKRLLEMLPVDEEKAGGIIDLTQSVVKKVKQVKNITSKFKDVGIAVKFGKKEIRFN